MNNKDLKDVLNNEEFIKNLIDSSNENFFITNKKPVYSLKECLETIDENILENIYKSYLYGFCKDKNLKKDFSKTNMIKVLDREIKDFFYANFSLFNTENRTIIDEIKTFKETDIESLGWLSNGFMFGFKKDNKTIYVVPDDLIEIYLNYLNSDEGKKNEIFSAEKFTYFYLLINGMVPIKFIEDVIINQYRINITKEKLRETLGSKYTIYKNKYYVLDLIEDDKVFIETLLEDKKGESYATFTFEEAEKYLAFIYSFSDELCKILGKKYSYLEGEIFFRCLSQQEPTDFILEDLNLPNNIKKNIEVLIDNNMHLFRYWEMNGKTMDDLIREAMLEVIPFSRKPKVTDLKYCLDNASSDYLDYLYTFENYDGIIELAKSFFDGVDGMTLSMLLNCNDNKLTNDIPTDFLQNGFAFPYKEGETIKCFIPDEIFDIMKNSFTNSVIDNNTEAIVFGYLNMNGVIRKEKLKELLKENESIDIKITNLDKVVKDANGFIIGNKYYTCISDLDVKEAEDIYSKKDSFGKYKSYDSNIIDKENEFCEKLNDFIKDSLSSDNVDDVCSKVLFLAKNAMFSKESLDLFLEENSVKESIKRKIVDLYKEYKKYISVWDYNGFSVTEINTTVKKNEKVGRNEPCPCGSGKKYKQCCGK